MSMDDAIEAVISLDEKIIWKGRRNNSILNFYLILGLALSIIVALFYFSQGTVEHFLGTSGGTQGSSIAALAILIGFFISFGVYFSKSASIYVITDKKVIVSHGLIHQTVNYAYHDKIRHTDVSYGILGLFMNIGTIYVDSGKIITEKMKRKEIRGLNMNPSKPKVVYYALKDVANPKKVQSLIERMIEKTKDNEQPVKLERKDEKTTQTPG
jgi:hypothetical protein